MSDISRLFRHEVKEFEGTQANIITLDRKYFGGYRVEDLEKDFEKYFTQIRPDAKTRLNVIDLSKLKKGSPEFYEALGLFYGLNEDNGFEKAVLVNDNDEVGSGLIFTLTDHMFRTAEEYRYDKRHNIKYFKES